MRKAIKTLLFFAIIIVMVMAGLALCIPGDVSARQLAFLILACVAVVVQFVILLILIDKKTTVASRKKDIASILLVLLSVLACGAMILVLFLNSGDLYARYGSMWFLPIVSVISLIVVYRLQFRKR